MQHLSKLILIAVLPFVGFSQISFYRSYSDNGYEQGHGIVQLPDSSYLVTGSSSSFSSNSDQAFILKTDSLGNRLWSKNYGGAEADHGRRIFYVENDGIYVAGQSNSFGTNFFDAYFFKTDVTGQLIYERNYGGSSYENIHDAVMLADTSFILVGETKSTANEMENIYVLRISKSGDTLWTKNFGSPGRDVAHGIEIMNDTTVILVGEYYVSDSLTQKAMILKMHINGTTSWLKTYGTEGKYVLKDLSVIMDTIRAVGSNQTDLSVTGNNSLFRMVCDPDGNFAGLANEINPGDYSIDCMTQFGSNLNDYYYAVSITDNPNIPTYPGGPDYKIYKFGMNLYFNGAQFYPSLEGADVPNQMIATSDGGAILVGTSEFPVFGGSNVVLVKIGPGDDFAFSNLDPLRSTLVSVQEQVKEDESVAVFPNPFSEELHVGVEKGAEINLIDQFGKVLFETISQKPDQLLQLKHISPGIYFLEIKTDGKTSRTKVLKD